MMFHNENKFKLVALVQFKVDQNHWLCSSFAAFNHKKPGLVKEYFLRMRQIGQNGGGGPRDASPNQ